MGTLYFPPSEQQGGWRRLDDDLAAIRQRAGMSPERLDELKAWALKALKSDVNGGLIIRHGWVVAEWANKKTPPERLVEIKSAAKALVCLCVGLAIDDARAGRQVGPFPPLDYDSLAYDYIPDGHPLSDPRKAQITVRQLMHHVAGITPECSGVSNYTPAGVGFWEYVLGLDPSFPTARLYADPGTKFLYGTYDIRHQLLILRAATGMELEDYIRARLYTPCGIAEWRMDQQGGNGRLGPHSDFRTYITARDFARIGYLMLHGGEWAGRAVIPAWLMGESMRQPFPDLVSRGFSYHWLHKEPTWPACVPDDLYYTAGAGINFCMAVPSLDLVAVHVGDAFGADWDQVFRDFAVRLCTAVEGAPAPPADATRPTLCIASPAPGQAVSGVVAICGTAADAEGVARVEVTIDGCGDEQLAEGTTDWRFAWDTTQLVDGPHKIAVRAFDLAGNASERVPPLAVTVANGGDQSCRRPFG